jgi:hypothetical protein
MAAVVSQVRFSESNDARPTYFSSALAAALLLIDEVGFRTSTIHTRSLYTVAICILGIAAICWIYCVLGCILHPIPRELRADGQIMSLHLTKQPDASVPEPSSGMFASLEDNVMADDEELVDSSEIEIRDSIQWSKMLFTTISLGCGIALMVIFAR